VHDLLCKFSDQEGCRAGVFTGLDETGQPRTDHRHAHIFCEANGPRDSITHITIWAAMGFDEMACFALRKITKVWGHGGHDIRLVLHGIGQADNFQECDLFRSSKVWRSLTPFVSTRHAKNYRDGRPKIDSTGWQIGSAAHDLLRLLGLRPGGAVPTIKQLDERRRPFVFGNRRLCSLQFQTVRRRGGGHRGSGFGNAFEIAFPGKIEGPLALGYGAHFGLGLFVPVSD
jgi:CRISPR-associated protein Csb2